MVMTSVLFDKKAVFLLPAAEAMARPSCTYVYVSTSGDDE